MASEHDLELVARIEAGTATGVVSADDPTRVAELVEGTGSAVCVDVDDLARAIAAARVRLAEVVVARARAAELAAASETEGRVSPSPGDPEREAGDGPHADRQAVRFALVILVLALVGGIAVYLADGTVLAPALPAAALLGLAGVVAIHRRPAATSPAQDPIGIDDGPVHVAVDDAPVVRAAEAHLRRQQAAWKVSWWERAEAVPDVESWSPDPATATPLTLVAVDPAGEVDAGAHATMTATAPAAVCVVVLQARG